MDDINYVPKEILKLAKDVILLGEKTEFHLNGHEITVEVGEEETVFTKLMNWSKTIPNSEIIKKA